VTSAIVRAEIEPAPEDIKQLFEELLPVAEIVEVSSKALELQQAYLDSGILTADSAGDALHVSLATVSGCEAIVSWNFKHIVHFRKIPLYNDINVARDYPALAIYSPREVIEYEDQDI